jgi:hypothetical protein
MIDRRRFLLTAGSLAASTLNADVASHPQRIRGMLVGSLIGDALGGPLEFAPGLKTRHIMPDARGWGEARVVDDAVRRELSRSLKMFGYADLRPETAAYGPWRASAPPGTLTDDSRHKIVLMRALRKMVAEGGDRLTEQDLARQFVVFQPDPTQTAKGHLAELLDEGLREYRYASRWVLGERDSGASFPTQRLWAGIPNCSGQMALIPLAGLFPGDPEAAYRETYRLDFIDAPLARDIASALNAGLAAALDPGLDAGSASDRWAALFAAMRQTDPYRIADVPFAGRPLDRWMDLADSIVDRCGGRPAEAYRLLESEGDPVYFWDAHFTLLVPMTMLKLCQYDGLAAMHLTLDFGHDTDSYAQVLGAMVGAVHGPDIFAAPMRDNVHAALRRDYRESIDDWMTTISAATTIYRD